MVFKGINGEKMTKRDVAKIIRVAASKIDNFGWVQNSFGDEERGFCAVGAINRVTNHIAPSLVLGSWLQEVGLVGLGQSAVAFNDDIAQEKKDVTRAMRQCARALEHGWAPGKEIP